MWGLVAIVAIAAIIAAALLSRQRKHTVDEEGIYSADVDPALGRYIHLVNTINDPTDEEYLRGVEQLRASQDRVLQDAARLLASDSDAPFAVRHSTLLAVAALKDGAALDLLSAVALNPQPLPPVDPGRKSATELHGGNALEAGTILSLDALQGIDELADSGNTDALDVLLRAVAVNSNPIKAVAMAALAARPERSDHLAKAKAALAPDHSHFADFRRVDLSDVPQIADPRIHLAGQEKGGPVAPDLTEVRDRRQDISSEHGAPTANGR